MCQAIGKALGAHAVTFIGCGIVYGKAVTIGPDEMDVQTGFEIHNFNMHASGSASSVPQTDYLPGPVSGYYKEI